MSYTKLFSSIVTSSIWTESDKVRIVWITILATCDMHGEIQASIPGLARIAGVSVEDCEQAIAVLTSPDPYSRTPTDQGRRLEPIDGGWAVVNHAKYRAMCSDEDKKQKNAERQRRYRERQARNGKPEQKVTQNVTHSNASLRSVTPMSRPRDAMLPHTDTDTPSDSDSDSDSHTKDKQSSVAERIYAAYPKKVAKGSAIKAIEKALKIVDAEKLIESVEAYAKATLWQDRAYIPYPASWFNDCRWEDDRKTWEKPKPQQAPPRSITTIVGSGNY
jgi:hypothetical protein